MSRQTSDHEDNDHTDELPILLEAVAFGDAPQASFPEPRTEDTAEHTALYARAEAEGSRSDAELAERAARIVGLEAELHAHGDRLRDLEQRLAERDERVLELKRTLKALRESLDDASAAERRLTTDLAAREATVAELTATVERQHAETASRSAELERLRAGHDAARSEVAALRSELQTRIATAPAPQTLLEENASLTAYIAGRRHWWDEAQATQTRLAARVKTLEGELETRAQRLAAADAFAARESSRAIELRAELVAAARRIDALERELRVARDAPEPRAPTSAARGESTEGGAPPKPAVVLPSPGPSYSHGAVAAGPGADDAAAQADASGAATLAAETLAQLEAEVEYKRQQVAAQLVELRDRDQKLRAATGELERAQRDLARLSVELDENRSHIARLEKTVIEKDRALDARDARIATLHDELKQRLGAIEKLNALDLALPKLDPPAANVEAPLERVSAPVLMGLTDDAPKQFALTKQTVTVGRGAHCDLQIVTHFVSREHARITFSDGTLLIEDLGSRNGVFVNSARVERRALRHGDVVTIGETRFRFVESMAH
jgi:predicted RNase H-like nuclease (RuvC/YqgF family)